MQEEQQYNRLTDGEFIAVLHYHAENQGMLEPNTLRELLHECDNRLRTKDQLIAERDQTIAEMDQAIMDKDRVIVERNQTIAENNRIITSCRTFIGRLSNICKSAFKDVIAKRNNIEKKREKLFIQLDEGMMDANSRGNLYNYIQDLLYVWDKILAAIPQGILPNNAANRN